MFATAKSESVSDVGGTSIGFAADGAVGGSTGAGVVEGKDGGFEVNSIGLGVDVVVGRFVTEVDGDVGRVVVLVFVRLDSHRIRRRRSRSACLECHN